MPAYFFSTDRYITGTVMANYTSGAPVRGNLTLKATIKRLSFSQNYRGYENTDVMEKPIYFTFVCFVNYLVSYIDFFLILIFITV